MTNAIFALSEYPDKNRVVQEFRDQDSDWIISGPMLLDASNLSIKYTVAPIRSP
jgi:hypothetical protein